MRSPPLEVPPSRQSHYQRSQSEVSHASFATAPDDFWSEDEDGVTGSNSGHVVYDDGGGTANIALDDDDDDDRRTVVGDDSQRHDRRVSVESTWEVGRAL